MVSFPIHISVIWKWFTNLAVCTHVAETAPNSGRKYPHICTDWSSRWKSSRGEGEQPSRNMCSSFTAQRLRHQGCHCHQSYHGVSEGRIGVSYGETFGLLVKPSGKMGASVMQPHLLVCIWEVFKVIVNHICPLFFPLHIMRISYFNTEASSRPTMTHKLNDTLIKYANHPLFSYD